MQETGFSELNNTAGTEPVPSGRRLPCNTRKRRAGCSSRPGDRAEVNMSSKRKDYISWDEYFMGVAQLAGMRSKDPNTQVGSCIVSSDHKILSMGYNGLPKGCDDDVFPWDRDGADQLMTKYPYVTHSELNANARRRSFRRASRMSFTTATSMRIRRQRSRANGCLTRQG